MRVTNNMMTNMLLHNLNRNMFNMSKLQEQGSDGKRVHKPSDDPIGISKILKFRTDLGELDQYQTNIRDVLNWYQVSESAITDLGKILTRSKELAVQAANGTYDANDLQKIRQELEQLRNHAVNAGNFSYAGRFVFSGYQNDKPLFRNEVIDGKRRVIYNIDITERDKSRPQKTEYLVGQTEEIAVTTNGLEVFGITNHSNVYRYMMTDSSGEDFDEGIHVLQARFNELKDYTLSNMNIKLTNNSVSPATTDEYEVDETLLTGEVKPIDRALILARYRKAKLIVPGATPSDPSTLHPTKKLGDVADIYFDSHDNLVIKTKDPNRVLSSDCDKIKFAETTIGVSSKKSQLIGDFTIDGAGSDYRKSNLSYTVGGTTYNVDTSELTGNGFLLKKEKVLDKIRNAEDGTGHTLSEVADVFFDHEGKLIIKDKEYGDRAISCNLAFKDPADPTNPAVAPIYAPTLYRGNAKTEASTAYQDFKFNDEYIEQNEDNLKKSPIFITYNGERTKIELDKETPIVTVGQYKTALQNAINKTIGNDKVEVVLTTDATTSESYLTFNTLNTPEGTKPEIYVEPVIGNRSSLIESLDGFIKALDTVDKEEIDVFLKDVDEHINRILSVRADIGAKTNRMELALERTKDNTLSFTKALSSVEDIDLAETIMKLKNYENVYRASLSTGTKIIQPSLVDFIK